jgi:hypothetical protein
MRLVVSISREVYILSAAPSLDSFHPQLPEVSHRRGRDSLGRGDSASFKALCDRLGVKCELEESEDQMTCKISRASTLKSIAPKTLKEQLAKQS